MKEEIKPSEDTEAFKIGGRRYCDSCNELLTEDDSKTYDICNSCASFTDNCSGF